MTLPVVVTLPKPPRVALLRSRSTSVVGWDRFRVPLLTLTGIVVIKPALIFTVPPLTTVLPEPEVVRLVPVKLEPAARMTLPVGALKLMIGATFEVTVRSPFRSVK
jgi:hypothetical protein